MLRRPHFVPDVVTISNDTGEWFRPQLGSIWSNEVATFRAFWVCMVRSSPPPSQQDLGVALNFLCDRFGSDARDQLGLSPLFYVIER